MLSKFRGRLGTDGFKRVFRQLVVLARQSGLVKDRLRLKDSTHVIANIAVPPVIKLIAQIRDRLLKDLEWFDPESATGFRVAVESLRESCKGATVAIQLEQRVDLLADVVQAAAKLPLPVDVETNVAWHNLRETLAVAQKILYDHSHTQEGRRTVSIVDSEARRGQHVDWYDGYVVERNYWRELLGTLSFERKLLGTLSFDERYGECEWGGWARFEGTTSASRKEWRRRTLFETLRVHFSRLVRKDLDSSIG